MVRPRQAPYAWRVMAQRSVPRRVSARGLSSGSWRSMPCSGAGFLYSFSFTLWDGIRASQVSGNGRPCAPCLRPSPCAQPSTNQLRSGLSAVPRRRGPSASQNVDPPAWPLAEPAQKGATQRLRPCWRPCAPLLSRVDFRWLGHALRARSATASPARMPCQVEQSGHALRQGCWVGAALRAGRAAG